MTSSKLSFIDTYRSFIDTYRFQLSVALLLGISILSAVIAMNVTGQNRMRAVGSVLLFGGLGGTTLLLHLWPSHSGGFEHRTIEYDGQHREALVVSISRTRFGVCRIGIGGALVGGGVIFSIYSIPSSPVLMRLLSFVLVLLGLLLLRRLITMLHKPRDLALLSDGIRLPSIAGGNFVPWNAIKYIGLITTDSGIEQSVLRIETRDRSEINLSVWGEFGWMIHPSDYYVSIPAHTVGVSGGKLKKTMSQLYHLSVDRLRLEHIQQYSETVREVTISNR
jgi:hypothetical protein